MRIPASDLPNWLIEITPLGAPALAIEPWGPFVFGPCPLPLTLARSPQQGGRWIEGLLGDMVIARDEGKEARPIAAQAQERMATILGGPRRRDGRPGWHPGEARHRGRSVAWAYTSNITEADRARAFEQMRERGLRTGAVTASSGFKRGDRSLMRGLHMAVSQDIANADPGELSGYARLTDHKQFNKDGTGEPFTGDYRSLRRLIAPGRRILELLGVWPWAHAEDGVLPADWRNNPEFVDPLIAWHETAIAESRKELDTNVRVFETEW